MENLLSGLAAQYARPGLISPSSRQQTLYPPPRKEPEALTSPHLKGRSGRRVQQDSFANVHHCVAATSLELCTAVFVKAGFIHHSIRTMRMLSRDVRHRLPL